NAQHRLSTSTNVLVKHSVFLHYCPPPFGGGGEFSFANTGYFTTAVDSCSSIKAGRDGEKDHVGPFSFGRGSPSMGNNFKR
ncbi:MAG TPA: hypothetical protein VN426_04365, partial [Syntrophomonadaceae bacterium]|nr:hypothetical protein [Syntrophomonadaceae bacterium]